MSHSSCNPKTRRSSLYIYSRFFNASETNTRADELEVLSPRQRQRADKICTIVITSRHSEGAQDIARVTREGGSGPAVGRRLDAR